MSSQKPRELMMSAGGLRFRLGLSAAAWRRIRLAGAPDVCASAEASWKARWLGLARGVGTGSAGFRGYKTLVARRLSRSAGAWRLVILVVTCRP